MKRFQFASVFVIAACVFCITLFAHVQPCLAQAQATVDVTIVALPQPPGAGEAPPDPVVVENGNADGVEIIALDEANVMIAGPGGQPQPKRIREWIRGLIQSELDRIDLVCTLDDTQKQSLVDVIEKEWRSKMSSVIQSLSQPNVMTQVDLEGRVEKHFIAWANSILNETQRQAWADELKLRFELRRDVVVGKMVTAMETKVGLTAKQMEEMTEVLNEKWKENWWTLYQSGSLPETKFSWITTILTDAQRTGYADRNSNRQEVWTHMQQPVDYPALPQTVRFSIGETKSSETIALTIDKADKQKENQGAQALPMAALRLLPAIQARRIAEPEPAMEEQAAPDKADKKNDNGEKADDEKVNKAGDNTTPQAADAVPQPNAEPPDDPDPFR